MNGIKNLVVALLLCLCTNIASAQTDKSSKTITLSVNQEIAFDKIIDFLQGKDIFIQSVDKQAGFVQGKIFLKQSKMLSAKAGERRTMNFFLRPSGNQTRVMLNIYLEQYNFGGDLSSKSYYYEDKGILDDAAVYRDVLNELKKSIN